MTFVIWLWLWLFAAAAEVGQSDDIGACRLVEKAYDPENRNRTVQYACPCSQLCPNTRLYSATHPVSLLSLGRIEPLSDCVRVVERPQGKLLQDLYLGENIEVVEFIRRFVNAEGIPRGSFRNELSPCIFIKNLGSVSPSAVLRAIRRQAAYVRPLCDETCLRRARPIAANCAEG